MPEQKEIVQQAPQAAAAGNIEHGQRSNGRAKVLAAGTPPAVKEETTASKEQQPEEPTSDQEAAAHKALEMLKGFALSGEPASREKMLQFLARIDLGNCFAATASLAPSEHKQEFQPEAFKQPIKQEIKFTNTGKTEAQAEA